MEVLSPLDAVAQRLEQQEHQIRIKKLLYCACTNQWENDPSQLGRYSLQSLIQQLIAQTPSQRYLRFKLDAIIRTLNKPHEYAAIAQTLAQTVETLYPQTPTAPSSEALFQAQCQQIAQALDQHEQALRIRKLLVCACEHRWETDGSRLRTIDLTRLVQELLTMTPTVEHLTAFLDQITKTLSKPAEYAVVGTAIAHIANRLHFQALPIDSEPTQMLGPVATPLMPLPPVASEVPLATPLPVPSGPVPDQQLPGPADWFEVRLNVMRYTNPLQAKILLFSSLYHPFTFSHQDWLTLKTYELDDLIGSLFQACTSFSSLQATLKQAMQTLDKPGSYVQTAQTVSQVLQNFYTPLPLASAFSWLDPVSFDFDSAESTSSLLIETSEEDQPVTEFGRSPLPTDPPYSLLS